MKVKCADCPSRIEWKGRGRKPKRCPPCKRKSHRAADERSRRRSRAHGRGEPVSRWGELWLTDGKAIRREPRFVWGATGDCDDTVTNRGGVFRYAGADGLPDGGVSTRDKALMGLLRTLERRVLQDPDAKAWLKANPSWWKIEGFAHKTLSMDVTDSVAVHASTYVDDPDESSPNHRCSWCGLARMLVLASEFCSEDCMGDYVRTFGPDGVDLGKVVHQDEQELRSEMTEEAA